MFFQKLFVFRKVLTEIKKRFFFYFQFLDEKLNFACDNKFPPHKTVLPKKTSDHNNIQTEPILIHSTGIRSLLTQGSFLHLV